MIQATGTSQSYKNETVLNQTQDDSGFKKRYHGHQLPRYLTNHITAQSRQPRWHVLPRFWDLTFRGAKTKKRSKCFFQKHSNFDAVGSLYIVEVIFKVTEGEFVFTDSYLHICTWSYLKEKIIKKSQKLIQNPLRVKPHTRLICTRLKKKNGIHWI